MSRYLLAHDLGTSGNKATLFDLEGNLVKSETVPYETSYSHVTWAEQDPADWWRAVCDSTRRLLAGIPADEVAVVAFSGQMMGCLPVDRKGTPLRTHMLYCDQRATPQADQLAEKLGAGTIYDITGHRVSSSYAIEKLMWVRDHQPEVFSQTHKMLNAKDYINFRLTGRLVTDHNDASGTNAFDLDTLDWSDRILDAARIERDMLPDAVPSTTVIGEITAEAAEATGLKAGTPVVAGAGDGGCATVGIGSVEPGVTYNYLGSSSWISTTSKTRIDDAAMSTFTWAHPVPGYLQPCGTVQTAGGAVAWLKSEIAVAETRDAAASGKSAYEAIDAVAARSAPGANGVLFMPYLLGERSPWWNPEAKGGFIGLTLGHTRADLFRAVLEGVTLNLDMILRAFIGQIHIDEMLVIGGGAKSPLWRQIMADVYGIDIAVPRYLEEATSMGAAIIGGVGAGLFDDFSVVSRFVEVVSRTSPAPESVSRYREIKPLFADAYRALEPLMGRLGA